MEIERIYADALLYDQEFAERVDDVSYYRNLARAAEGTVLEIACGTGRLTIPIADSGKEIVGIDLVASMLERAEGHPLTPGHQLRFDPDVLAWNPRMAVDSTGRQVLIGPKIPAY